MSDKSNNVFISYSQQFWNKCNIKGCNEQKHMYEIAKILAEKIHKHPKLDYKLATFHKQGSQADILKWVVEESMDYTGKDGLHLSLHSDGGYKGHGCSCLVMNKKGEGYKVAQHIYARLSALTPWSDMGITERPELYELRKTPCKAVIVEVSFHDQHDEALFIHNQKRFISDALYVGLLKYYGLKYV